MVLLTVDCSSIRRRSSSSSINTTQQAPDAAIICVASSSYNIDVTIDGNQYHVKTVKSQDLERNLKHAADNMIYVSPGNHKVTIRSRGKIVYDKRIRFRSDETMKINL